MLSTPIALFLSLVPSASQVGAPVPRVAPGTSGVIAVADVPLEFLPGAETIASTSGVSFLDYDVDGWIDVYVHREAELWRNQDGAGFQRVADLDRYLPRVVGRYGAACGDFDNDGLPDIACEPRADCFYLLRNLDGAGHFLEVATDPEIVLHPPGCGMWAETFCWADVDEDGDLDLWLPAYPDEIVPGSGGNRFFENLGPTGPGGVHRLANRTLASGLGIPASVSSILSRPEGAQFVDVDRDGDLDAFANSTVYQNVTGTEGPRFRQLVNAPTGISIVRLDEGAFFFDYDLDGDQDLLVLYERFQNRIWENEGDGTFLASDVIELPAQGATLGCSAEDWDLDGDLDLTTGRIFRRNLMVESGQRFLRVATHSLGNLPTSAIPAWGD